MAQPPQPTKWLGPLTLFATNRRFRLWAIGLLISLPVLYVVSFGPACWITARPLENGLSMVHHRDLFPFVPLAAMQRAGIASNWLRWWMELGVPKDHAICVVVNLHGDSLAWVPVCGNSDEE